MYYNNGTWKKKNNRAKPAELPKRTDSVNHRGETTIVFVKNRETKKMPVPEHAVDFMKNMNPQQLVDLLFAKLTS